MQKESEFTIVNRRCCFYDSYESFEALTFEILYELLLQREEEEISGINPSILH